MALSGPRAAGVSGGAPPPGREPGRSAGLTTEEARQRLARAGANTIREQRSHPLLTFLSFFWGPIPWMIEVAAVLSGAIERWDDFAIIVVMLLLNAGVGFWEEFKADTAIDALKQQLAPVARVRRDGTWRDLPAEELVPDDAVFLAPGNIVPADVELLEGDYLSVDQSALTGESMPVDKAPGDTAYSGSIVRQGEMAALVTATGMGTYFGKTAGLVQTAQTRSHFQQAVLRIGNFLILTTIGLVLLILTVALFRGDPLADTVLFALILTVAAIPVALPAVLSVTMAVGASRLAALRAIVSRLVSIEEMAGMDVLCSDKTGTLTKNELTLGDPVTVQAQDAGDVVLAAALACGREGRDPIDGPILKAVSPGVLDAWEVVSFTPFDPVRKRAEAEVRGAAGTLRVAKGAPQAILDLVQADADLRARVEGVTADLAAHGYRTLGVARAEGDGPSLFLGLLPLFDPPRDDSAQTIAAAKAMGLDVRMVTGDHTAIGRETARKLGLSANIVSARELFAGDGGDADSARIEAAEGFAEVFPEHKFKVVRTLQAAGHIVGMTGDGVNDAPALKQADVGIAVSGATDAARAAADLVLTAPGLSVITTAVDESRKIFERMNGYAIFRIAETIRVLLFMTVSILVFNFYPVTALMIVLLAILNDFPIMMIAFDNAPPAARPVRWDMHRVLTVSVVLGILGVVSTFLLFWVAEVRLGLPRSTIQTLLFLKLLVAGHLTIYLTRNTGPVWQRPLPDWRLVVTTEATQVFGTLAAVYGWFVEPIGWRYALLVWAYALAWFLFNSVVKIGVYRSLSSGPSWYARHASRVHRSLHSGVR